MKIQIAETIQSYFTRVSHIKEQLEAVYEEVENAEIVMTTLNGLPRTWDYFIQWICAKNKLVKFNRLWEVQQTMGRMLSKKSSNNSSRRKDGK